MKNKILESLEKRLGAYEISYMDLETAADFIMAEVSYEINELTDHLENACCLEGFVGDEKDNAIKAIDRVEKKIRL